jgi:hypothetical protein
MAGNILQSERTQRIVAGAAVAAVVLLVAIFGISEANDSAQAVFWAAVKNSMNTTALTVQSSETSAGTTEDTMTQLDFGQHPASQTLTTLKNDGAMAQTETLTTPSAAYTRYVAIHKTVHGKPLNFSHITGIWAKTASYSDDTIPPTFPQVLLNQLLPLPLGYLTASQRTGLLQQMQDNQVYTVNFSSTKKTTYQGRPAYVYKVSIQPVLYLQLIKSYAPDLDMHQLDQFNPNSYSGEAAVSASWTIDAKAKELVRADYSGGRSQTYGGWGVPLLSSPPIHPVSASDLQRRLDTAL